MNTITPLKNHTSEQTAYVVDDYPYGFRLRCQIRYWIETTKRGQRFCTQTLNPKNNRWNNPKKTTYASIVAMFIDESTGYVEARSISTMYEAKLESLTDFIAKYDIELTDYVQNIIKELKIKCKFHELVKVEYVIRSVPKTQEEKDADNAIMNKAYSYATHLVNKEQ